MGIREGWAENETSRFQKKLNDRNRTMERNGYDRGDTVSRCDVRGIWVMGWWVADGREDGGIRCGRIVEGYGIRCIVNVGTNRREVSVVLL